MKNFDPMSIGDIHSLAAMMNLGDDVVVKWKRTGLPNGDMPVQWKGTVSEVYNPNKGTCVIRWQPGAKGMVNGGLYAFPTAFIFDGSVDASVTVHPKLDIGSRQNTPQMSMEPEWKTDTMDVSSTSEDSPKPQKDTLIGHRPRHDSSMPVKKRAGNNTCTKPEGMSEKPKRVDNTIKCPEKSDCEVDLSLTSDESDEEPKKKKHRKEVSRGSKVSRRTKKPSRKTKGKPKDASSSSSSSSSSTSDVTTGSDSDSDASVHRKVNSKKHKKHVKKLYFDVVAGKKDEGYLCPAKRNDGDDWFFPHIFLKKEDPYGSWITDMDKAMLKWEKKFPLSETGQLMVKTARYGMKHWFLSVAGEKKKVSLDAHRLAATLICSIVAQLALPKVGPVGMDKVLVSLDDMQTTGIFDHPSCLKELKAIIPVSKPVVGFFRSNQRQYTSIPAQPAFVPKQPQFFKQQPPNRVAPKGAKNGVFNVHTKKWE